MIDLYAAPTTNGLRVKIMLDECGLEYRLHVLDLRAGENRRPEYLAINPMGQIPAIVDPEGPDGAPVTLTQSIVILNYLAQKSGRFLPGDAVTNLAFWRDVQGIATDLTGTLTTIMAIMREAEPHRPTLDLIGNQFNRYLRVWDTALAEKDYVAGNEVTIADFAFYPVVYRCRAVTPEYAEGCPNVDRWHERLSARPGVQKGLDLG